MWSNNIILFYIFNNLIITICLIHLGNAGDVDDCYPKAPRGMGLVTRSAGDVDPLAALALAGVAYRLSYRRSVDSMYTVCFLDIIY